MRRKKRLLRGAKRHLVARGRGPVIAVAWTMTHGAISHGHGGTMVMA